MTRTASCMPHFLKAQDLMALRVTGVFIILSLLLPVVSVDAYNGVYKRKDGTFYCEVTVRGSSPRQKIWVGTYNTETLAALACDVAFFYTDRPSNEFNLEYSEDAILNNCKPRSSYEYLSDWIDRRRFIRAQVNALIMSLPDFSWEDVVAPSVPSVRQKPEFRWEDVVPPSVSLRRRAGEIAWGIVDYFRVRQAERLPAFMAWLMHLANEQRETEEQESQLYIDEELGPGVERFVNVHRITLRVQSLLDRPTNYLWLTSLILGSLPLIFKMFESESGDINDASVYANDATRTEQERHQSSLQIANKRQKVNHPSISLVTDQEECFTAINYYIRNEAWHCTGFDLHSKTWKALPAFSCLPPPHVELFKEYSVCGDGGLMCADVAKLPQKGELVVFNPLTGKTFTLPPLLYPRSPVLVHMSVNSATKSYKVIVAGSSFASDEHLSQKMEVFDSNTSRWEEAHDLPGPVFGLNEHQTGVCVNEVLYFISFLDGGFGRGVVAFDVENGKWLENMTCPLPCSFNSTTLQLVECNEKVYLFSEQDRCGSVEHSIDVLEISNHKASSVEKCHWRSVVRVKKIDGRGLQIFPENTCVTFGEGKLCVFNTLTRDGVVYNMQDGKQCEVLQAPPPDQHGDDFFSLNPAIFTLQPSFDSDPVPWSADANFCRRQKENHPSIPLLTGREECFTAINFYTKNQAWQCTGFDLHTKTWKTLPPFSHLPPPNVPYSKKYSVCGHGSLMCVDDAKGKLVVFNPLTGKSRALPPLLYPRSPVLVHILVNSATESYKVIVAGSSSSDEHLSKKMEVFESNTSKWEEASDLPGPGFGLNEYQTGVCVNGVLYFISFLKGSNVRDKGVFSRGVVAFDVENKIWLENMTCPIPFSSYWNTLQLVENNEKVYLFSEQEHGGSVDHCIYLLEFSDPAVACHSGAVHWRNVVRVKASGRQGLQVYPEPTCVPFGEGRLCIFNPLTCAGVVYDTQDGKQCEVLTAPPSDQTGDKFFSLNPVSFMFQPSYDSDPIAWSGDYICSAV